MAEAGTEQEQGRGKAKAADDPVLQDGEKMPYLDWTREDVDEFQAIWSALVGTTSDDLKLLGINLLIWMFENIPDMKGMFKNFDANKNRDFLVSDEKFLKHTQRVVVQLNKFIKKIDRPSIIEDMRCLARTHFNLKPRVQPKFFEDFRDNFHLLVHEMTKTGKHERPAVLWYKFLDTFVVIMKEEEAKMGPVDQKAPEKKGCCSVS